MATKVTDPELLRILNGGGGPVYGPPPSRSQQREEVRRDRDQQLQETTTAFNMADANRDDARTDRSNRLDLPQKLRKEFSSLPEVREYTTAAQQLAQALNTGDGAQADLALTYAFAKAMDPNSVVREAEQAMVTGSQPIVPGYVENLRKQLGADEAGNYTPETRAKLRQQIIRSVAARRQLYEQARKNFSENARRNGIDPTEVIGPHAGDAYRAQARAYDQKRRAAGANVGYPTGSGIGGMVGGMIAAPRQASTASAPRVWKGPRPVRFPDGRVVNDVPEGLSRDQLFNIVGKATEIADGPNGQVGYKVNGRWVDINGKDIR